MDIDYQFAALDQGKSDVTSAVNRILGEVEDLQRSVGQSYAAWDSRSARGAYESLQRNWDTTEVEIRAAVTKFARSVGQAGADMSSTENANAGRLST